MADLLSLLSFGSNAISRTNSSISVTTNNVANVDTEGYSRQRTDDKTGDAVRVSSNLLSSQVQTAAGSLAMSQAFADALSELESGMTSGGTIDSDLGNLFSKMSSASAAPTDSASRDAVVAAARALVSGIQRRASEAATLRKEADQRIRDNATTVTSLAKQLASANSAVARSGSADALDQRDKVAKQLGQLVGGQARVDGDGQMRYTLEGGAVLVDGIHAASMQATPDPTTGVSKVEVVDGSSRRDVTASLTSGSTGAQLQFRDQTMVGVQNQLDQVASDITTSFNAVHTANAGLDGVSGRPLFTPLTGVAGAASAIQVDPTIAGNSKLLALGAQGAGPGDNAGALAMFQLGSQNVASGGTKTLGDAAIDIVSGIAQSSADAKGAVTRDSLVSDHLASLRDSLSGVDTQEEMTNLARFQNASSAMTKVVSSINDMLGSLIDAL